SRAPAPTPPPRPGTPSRPGRARRARATAAGRSLQPGELGEKPVDLVAGVVVHEPHAHRPTVVLESEPLHHLERVVVAVPDREAALAQSCRCLARRDAVDGT